MEQCPNCGKSDYFEAVRKTYTVNGVGYYKALSCNVCGTSWVIKEEECDEDCTADE